MEVGSDEEPLILTWKTGNLIVQLLLQFLGTCLWFYDYFTLKHWSPRVGICLQDIFCLIFNRSSGPEGEGFGCLLAEYHALFT